MIKSHTCLSLRNVRSALPLLTLALAGLVLPCVARGQVAFTGASKTVISEGTNPTAIAADSVGNLYLINEHYNSYPTEYVFYTVDKYTLQADGSYEARTLAKSSSTDVFTDLAVDADENVYYTNTPKNEVAELIVSNGTYSNKKLPITVTRPSAIAIDASGSLYVTDLSGDVFKESPIADFYSATTVVGGLGSDVVFGIAVDTKGAVYMAEKNNQQFLVETPNGSGYSQSTFSVSGVSVAANPVGIKVDSLGNVYVTDVTGNSVFEEVPSSGSYTQYTVLRDLATPTDLALDAKGKLYVADTYGSKVIEAQLLNVGFASRPVSTAGTSSDTLALNFSISSGTTVGSVKILTGGASGQDFKDDGSSTCMAQTYASATTCVVNINFTPQAPGARNGAVVIADDSGNPLVTVPVCGTGTAPQAIFAPANNGTVGASLFQPEGIAFDGAGNLYAAVNADHVVKIAPDGTQSSIGSGFAYPTGVAVDGAGNVYVVDSYTARIDRVTPSGAISNPVVGVGNGTAVAVDGAGNLYFQYANSGSISKLAPSGNVSQIGSGFENIYGLAVDSGGTLYASDISLNTLFKITPSGVQTPLVTGLHNPAEIAIDAAGDLYVSESGGSLLEYSNTGELLATLASGDQFYGVALDNAGNVYYSAQSSGERPVGVIQRSAAPAFKFATTNEGQVSIDGPQTFTIQNIGNDRLQFSNIHFPSGFPEVSSETECRLNWLMHPGDDCTLGLEFHPFKEYSGSPTYNWSGSVIVTSNTLNAPGTTAFAGTSGTMTFPSAATPVISPAGGNFRESQSVTISCSTPESTIFYTTNGSYPTAGSEHYTGPITVSSSATISALCAETGYIPSTVVQQRFTIK